MAAVAVGAFAAAAAGQAFKAGQSSPSDDIAPLADSKNASAAIGVGGTGSSAAAPEVLAVAKPMVAAPVEAQQIASTNQIVQNRAAVAAAAKAEAERPKFFKPAEGTLTSGFGARWGTTHYGLDIANSIGTPILSAADGEVIEAGSASGFGLWVRVQHDDGTITVYGHVDSYNVREGQRVKAGEQIARMGNRGYSTGPHLHFEVWDADGQKINPRTWLLNHGVAL